MDFQFRQGDILLVSVDEIPEGAQEHVTSDRVVLAYGEATGHAHAIPANMARYYHYGDLRLIEVTEGATLVHEEHATIPLPAGCYRVLKQRKFIPPEPDRQEVDYSYELD